MDKYKYNIGQKVWDTYSASYVTICARLMWEKKLPGQDLDMNAKIYIVAYEHGDLAISSEFFLKETK